MKQYKYLIIGGGAAALYAAQGIREIDREGSVLMISEESLPAYTRPMLTKSPLFGWDPMRIVMETQDWYQEQKIDLLLSESVTGIDPQAHAVSASPKGAAADSQAGSFNETYRYEKLIYAAGASAFVPPIPGADLPEVKVIRTHEDIEAIRRLSLTHDQAVIIGGGVIGLEAGFELTRYGVSVTVLEALPRLMPRFLDEECAGALKDRIAAFPVHTGVSIEEIGGDGHVEYVKLTDGRVFPCGFVIMSTGVRANTKLAQDAGIGCGRAVIINEKSETSVPDVYACGDCAEYGGVNYQLWSTAQQQGRAAGVNAAGGDANAGVPDASVILNSPDISLFSLGDTTSSAAESGKTVVTDTYSQPPLFAVNSKYAGSFEKRYYTDGKLTGAVIIGNLANMQALREEILGNLQDQTKEAAPQAAGQAR